MPQVADNRGHKSFMSWVFENRDIIYNVRFKNMKRTLKLFFKLYASDDYEWRYINFYAIIII